jgi:uncharacterized protein (TIGR02145 family)
MKKILIIISLLIPILNYAQTIQNINRIDSNVITNNIVNIDSIIFPSGGTQMKLILNNAIPYVHSIQDINNVTFELNEDITSLVCDSSSLPPCLLIANNLPISWNYFSVPYTGGNGASYNTQTITSTGVFGLTATLGGGNFATGAGTLNYKISGTPSSSGIANFLLSIGGQTCSISINVINAFCDNGPTAVVDVINPITGKIWMDRNLGATQVANSSIDVNSFGDTYQWGRGSDGHQCRTSPITYTISSTDQPSNGDFIVTYFQGASDNWFNYQNPNLWQGVNGINNPCPTGYRLPTAIELDTERLSWISNDGTGAFASPLKLPLAGFRVTIYEGEFSSAGSIARAGCEGFYWSSTTFNNSSSSLYISSSNTQIFDSYRIHGISVRCIKN